MVGPAAVVKCAGIAIAIALPVTLPTLVERCTRCIRKKGNVAKEASLGILNCVLLGTVEVIRKVLAETSGPSGAPEDAKATGGAVQ